MPVPSAAQLETYAQAPSRLLSLLSNLDTTTLQYAPSGDEWSIHEVVVHLTDSELVGSWRLRRTIAEPGSLLQAYAEPTWARTLDYKSQDMSLAIQLFTALRASNNALLRSLPHEAWDNTSTHAENGEMSLYDIFLTLLRHVDIHIAQIEQLMSL